MGVRITSRVRRVLVALNADSPRTLRQLCVESGLRRGTVGPMLDRLVDTGMAQGSPAVGGFRLTDKGRRAI